VAKSKEKEFIYIVQSSKELTRCKIGKTNNLERRLKEYNNITGKSKDTVYSYLFACEVADMAKVEKDIAKEFTDFREQKSREIYFYNKPFFEKYVNFIKSHKLFTEEISVKKLEPKEIVKIIKRTTPTLEDRGLSPKDLMQKAKNIKNDEFYTRYEDVEKEIAMYDKSIWKDKVVFCNCDDAIDLDEEIRSSAFSWYFYRHFKELELKKLICVHYAGKVDLFNAGAKAYTAYVSITTDGEHLRKEYPKGFTGSFDHPLSLKILKEEADIVCTNPPFSRAIDYWETIIKSKKKFLIISNISNAINTAYIPYFKNNRVWAGYNGVDWYLTPKKQLTSAAGHWYTNIPIKNRPKYKHLKIVPLKDIPEKYKQYDDSETLLVDNCFIPNDYKEPFAVSVRPILNGLLEKGYKIIQDKRYTPYTNGKEGFARLLVQKI
jgi:hypothetical protein